MKKDSLITGLLIGFAVPFVSLALLMEINDWIISMKLPTNQGQSFGGFSLNLTSVIALCLNIFPFRYFTSRKMDQSMRGMVFPTVIYAIGWAWYFGKMLI